MKGAFSYPRCARILSKPEYDQVFNKGSVYKTPGLVAYSWKNNSDAARLGVITSKKSAKKAVDRNRIKRLCKNTFRLKRNLLLSKDFVILARPKAKHLSNQELVQCLEQLFDSHLKSFNTD
jgi:ribonuclease P protein component